MLTAIADQLAQAIRDGVALDELQVLPRFEVNPTGPSIDIYPSSPSQEDATFGRWPRLTIWTVRARVGVVDHDANQDLLLELLDPSSSQSVAAAIMADTSLNGLAEGMDVDQPTGFNAYPALLDASAAGYLGCEWRVRVYANGGIPG